MAGGVAVRNIARATARHFGIRSRRTTLRKFDHRQKYRGIFRAADCLVFQLSRAAP